MAQSALLLVEFRELKNELTPTEMRIATYIETHISETVGMTISELAGKCQASESGIVRLCKKIGLKGYQELKIILAQKMATQADRMPLRLSQDVTLTDSIHDICGKVFAASVQALRDTESILKSNEMEKAVALVCGAASLNFYGLGGSGVIANDAYYRFFKLGISCGVFTDVRGQINRSLQMTEQDVIISISHSGCSRDLLKALLLAKQRGASVIAVTQFGNTPITKLADVSLYTSSQETVFRHDAMASRIAETVLLDSLFTCAAIKRYERVTKHYEDSWDVLRDMRISSLKEI